MKIKIVNFPKRSELAIFYKKYFLADCKIKTVKMAYKSKSFHGYVDKTVKREYN